MNDDRGSSNRNWSFSELQKIDAVCDEFERAWGGNARVAIEELIAQNAELPRASLLDQLLRLELHFRRAAGESLALKQYQERFPSDEAIVARVWQDFAANAVSGDLPSTTTLHKSPRSPGPLPEWIGPFKILKFLGRGSFGTVYLAIDPISDSEIALKVPHPKNVESARRLEDIWREFLTAKKLDHPNLVRTLRIEQVEGQLVIVQQYINGQNLTDWCAQTRPTPEQVVRLLIPVAQALGYLHEQSVFHRDLKPGNILVDHNDNPYVTDFGLSLHEDQQRDPLRRGELAGTYAYMAPEQVRRQVQLIDGQTDLWSFGIILYRLLTDRFPFGGPPPRSKADESEYFRDLEFEIEGHDPRPPRQINPTITRKLEQICLRCLEKRKRDRYQTGHDLAEDLRLVLERSKSVVPEPSRGKKFQIVPKGLRSFDAADAPFFLELLPGPRTLDGIPTSLNFWKSRLSDSGGDTPIDVGVVYGPSGCGKSSLIKAGLIPLLGDKFVPLIIESTPDDTEVRLLKALRKALPRLPQEDSLIDACRWAVEHGAGNGRKILLVFDQFEQWLHSHPITAEHQLLTALRHCNGTRLQALLLVRDDFWMPLTRFMDQLEIPLQENHNIAAVDLFDCDHARKVLLGLGRAYGRLSSDEQELTAAQDEFLSRAVEGLAEDRRIICVRLALFAEMMKDRAWTPEELDRVGDAKGVGVAFLEEKFGPKASAVYRPYSAAVRKVLEALLPPYGSNLKEMKAAAELREITRAPSPFFRELLRILDTDLKLLTPVVPDEPSSPSGRSEIASGSLHYQLTHDYLVPSIREWLTTDLRRTRAGQALLRLRERSEDWNRQPEPRRLPSLMEWLSIQVRVPRRTWTPPQRTMMSAASRRIFTGMVIAAAIAMIVAFGTWELRGRILADSVVGELAFAQTSKVPEIASRVPPLQRWVGPKIKKQLRSNSGEEVEAPLDDSEFTRWLNLQLVASQFDPARVALVLDQIARIPPDDLMVVQEMLTSQKPQIAQEVAKRLTRAAATRDKKEVLPLAAMLAWAEPENAALKNQAPLVSEQLRDAPPTEFSVWLKQLQPIAEILHKPLLFLWSRKLLPSGTLSAPPEGTQRTHLIAAIALYAANESETLLRAMEHARPPEFAAFLAPLKALKPNSISLEPSSPLLPQFQPLLKKVQGQISASGAFALKAEGGEVAILNQPFEVAGYTLVSLRPYQAGEVTFYTACWKRAERKSRFELALTTADFRRKIAEYSKGNFTLTDFAFAGRESSQDVNWCGVWTEARPVDSPTEVDVDLPIHALSERGKDMEKGGYCLARFAVRANSDTPQTYTAIWTRMSKSEKELANSPAYTETISWEFESRYGTMYGDLHPGQTQSDLRAESVKPDRSDVAVALANYLRAKDSNNTQSEVLGKRMNACRKYTGAVDTCDQALVKSPDDFDLRLTLAEALAAAESPDRLTTEIGKLEEQLASNASGSTPNRTPKDDALIARQVKEVALLKIRLAVLRSNQDQAITTMEALERLIGRGSLKAPDGMLLASANALLARVFASKDAARSSEYEKQATSYLARVLSSLDRNRRPFPYSEILLLESPDWDGLRRLPAFQDLVHRRGCDRRYLGVWISGSLGLTSRHLMELPAEKMVVNSSELMRERFWPCAIAPVPVGKASEMRFTSVWHASLMEPKARFELASQRANRALAAAHWGDDSLLNRLLEDRSGERESAMLAIERLAPSGYPADRLKQLLDSEIKSPLIRNILLALGDYSAEAVSAKIKEKVRTLAVGAPEPEVASAADWCARQWGLERLTPNVAIQPAEKSVWYLNSQGQRMIRLDGTLKFLMGSPEWEAGREASENRQWMRIERKFAVSATLVTAREYRRFLSDPEVKSRIPETIGTLSRRNELTERMWHLDCPQGSLRRLDAMLYCEWLSEKDGLPEKDRCYPKIWEFAERLAKGKLTSEEQRLGYWPPDDILTRRSGYRLPTEAELEYAIRGGSAQARHFGDAEELLDAYCWYGSNAGGKTWPVGTKKPNEFGLFDSLGNVTQHCQDLYQGGYGHNPDFSVRNDDLPDKKLSGQEATYVMRGGDFRSPPRHLRSAKRFFASPQNPRYTQGFRVARTEF